VEALAYTVASLAGIVSFHGGPFVPTDAQAAAIKIKVLICHGAIDPFIKPEQLSGLLKALDKAKVGYQFVSYAGAVHAFTNPNATRIAQATGLNGIGYNEAAARRSWLHMQDFFGDIFGR
jgi:dienelactone hydrolase